MLSFTAILKDAIDNKYKKILILEDDVIFHKEFQERIQKYDNLEYKLLLLGVSQHVWRFTEMEEDATFYHPGITDGAFAVGIDSSVFEEILQSCEAKNSPFDSGPLRDIYKKYPKECYVLYPNLVIADLGDSDIRSGRNQAEYAATFKWNLEDYHYPHVDKKVSIVIPAYNAEKTIWLSIESLLKQTYDNVEIIVVNDCSSDKTDDVIKSFLPNDKIVYLVNEQNMNCYKSKNRGIDASTGYYICYQDADDFSLPTRIEKQVEALIRKNLTMVTCNFVRSHVSDFGDVDFNDVKTTVMDKVNGARVHLHPNGVYKYCCRDKLGLVTTLYKKSLLDKIGNFLELKWGCDSEMCERIFNKINGRKITSADNIHTIMSTETYIENFYYLIPEILYLSYEMTENNMTIKYHKAERDLYVAARTKWLKNFESN